MVEAGDLGQYDVLLGDEKLAGRGGSFLQRLLGGGWPTAEQVIEELRRRGIESQSRPS